MSPDHPVDIAWIDLVSASALVMVAIALSAWQRLGLGKSLIVGGIRATVQLIVVGHVLLWIFAADEWYIVVGVMLLMVLVAAMTTTDRIKGAASAKRQLRLICGASIFVGSVLTLAYVDAAIVPISPWYNPRYLIPLFGMIIANSMNGAALAAERLQSEMDARRGEVEAFLALGASPERASAEPVRRALIAAMIPAVNSLAVVGIVSLPGMMTGQIMSGTDPTLAVRYQLVVVFMLTAASAITAAGVVFWYRKLFFTAAEQLVPRA